MDDHGKTDWSRERKTSKLQITMPLRVSAGGSNHNYAFREGERQPWTLFRDPPRECISQEMLKYGDGELCLEFGKLLDFVQDVLDDILPFKILNDDFIYELFTRPFLDKFGCQTCRFPCFDVGVSDMDEIKNSESKSPSIRHCDMQNGQQLGNSVSATFSRFFYAKKVSEIAREELEKDPAERSDDEMEAAIEDIMKFLLGPEEDVERLKRFFLIVYTRHSHELFKVNEKIAESLKNKLRIFRDTIDEAYKPMKGSFLKPFDIDLSDTRLFEETVISNEFPHLTCRCIRVPASYCREVKCSSAMTVICWAGERLSELGVVDCDEKMLHLILAVLYLGSFAKMFLWEKSSFQNLKHVTMEI